MPWYAGHTAIESLDAAGEMNRPAAPRALHLIVSLNLPCFILFSHDSKWKWSPKRLKHQIFMWFRHSPLHLGWNHVSFSSLAPEEKPLRLPVVKVYDRPDTGCIIVGRVDPWPSSEPNEAP